MKAYMKKVILALTAFAACFAIGFMSNVAYSYSINAPGGYSGTPYQFRLNTSFTSTQGSAMSAGAKAWEDAGKGSLAKKSSYTNNLATYPVKDGINNVTFISVTDDYLAESSYWKSGTKITESDINFNAKYSWSTNPSSTQYDIQMIMTHEIGHCLGLGHSTDSSAIMRPTFSAGSKQHTINSDDIAGIQAIY